MDLEVESHEKYVAPFRADILVRDLAVNHYVLIEYDFAYQTAVSVRENKSPRGERMTQEAIKNGFMMKSVQSESTTATLQKRSDVTIFECPSEITKKEYEAIKLN